MRVGHLETSVCPWGPENTLCLHLRVHLECMYRRLGRADDASDVHVPDRTARDFYGVDDRETCKACGFAFSPEPLTNGEQGRMVGIPHE